MQNESRFTLDLNRFPRVEWPGIAQAIVDQGNAQVGARSINATLDRHGMVTVICTPGDNWLKCEGFRAAVIHWLDSR